MRRMAPSRTGSVLILGVPCIQCEGRLHLMTVPSAPRAQRPAKHYTPRKYASTLTYTDSAIMRSTSCTRRRPRCLKAPSVPKGGALDMIQFLSLKYAFDHVLASGRP